MSTVFFEFSILFWNCSCVTKSCKKIFGWVADGSANSVFRYLRRRSDRNPGGGYCRAELRVSRCEDQDLFISGVFVDSAAVELLPIAMFFALQRGAERVESVHEAGGKCFSLKAEAKHSVATFA